MSTQQDLDIKHPEGWVIVTYSELSNSIRLHNPDPTGTEVAAVIILTRAVLPSGFHTAYLEYEHSDYRFEQGHYKQSCYYNLCNRQIALEGHYDPSQSLQAFLDQAMIEVLAYYEWVS